MPEEPLTIEQILTMLAGGPARIAVLTGNLVTEQLHGTPYEGGWSLNDILAHLRACADVWGDCIGAILTQDKPTLRAINPRTWIKRTDYLEQEFLPSLNDFTKQRNDLLEYLRPLAPDAWMRSATVTGAGKTLVRTVHFYAQWMATHERSHISHIQRIVKTIDI